MHIMHLNDYNYTSTRRNEWREAKLYVALRAIVHFERVQIRVNTQHPLAAVCPFWLLVRTDEGVSISRECSSAQVRFRWGCRKVQLEAHAFALFCHEHVVRTPRRRRRRWAIVCNVLLRARGGGRVRL